MDIKLREALAADASDVASVYLCSRETSLPFAPIAHSNAGVARWIANKLIPTGRVTVAEVAGKIVGMMALSKEDGVGWIDHLYLHPSAVGKGIGTQLLNRAKEQLGSPIHLYTFQENVGSRRFYEPNGFSPIDYSNGATNEEKCPDVLYEFESKTSIPTTEDPEP